MKYLIISLLFGLALSINRVSVHDPSIIKDNGKYYVFGSHLATAKSADLINWTLMSGDYQNPINNPVYGIYKRPSENHLNGLDIMKGIIQVENMEYGHLMYFIIKIMFGVMEAEVHICSTIVHLQLGVVLALDF